MDRLVFEEEEVEDLHYVPESDEEAGRPELTDLSMDFLNTAATLEAMQGPERAGIHRASLLPVVRAAVPSQDSRELARLQAM